MMDTRNTVDAMYGGDADENMGSFVETSWSHWGRLHGISGGDAEENMGRGHSLRHHHGVIGVAYLLVYQYFGKHIHS